MDQFPIEPRALSLVFLGSPIQHDFWVLNDSLGSIIAEMHGLASISPKISGKHEYVAVGTDENLHSLRVWQFVHDAAASRQINSMWKRVSQVL